MKKYKRYFGVVLLLSLAICFLGACKADDLDGTVWKSTESVGGIDIVFTAEFNSPDFSLGISSNEPDFMTFFTELTSNMPTVVTGSYSMDGNAVSLISDKGFSGGSYVETGTLTGDLLSVGNQVFRRDDGKSEEQTNNGSGSITTPSLNTLDELYNGLGSALDRYIELSYQNTDILVLGEMVRALKTIASDPSLPSARVLVIAWAGRTGDVIVVPDTHTDAVHGLVGENVPAMSQAMSSGIVGIALNTATGDISVENLEDGIRDAAFIELLSILEDSNN